MDIKSIVVGGGPIASMIVLTQRDTKDTSGPELPIRIGPIEASAISMGVSGFYMNRPITHDLLVTTIEKLGATLSGVEIYKVQGTTFYAQLLLLDKDMHHIEIDARPSDAIALAVRLKVPIFASDSVLEKAMLPDFGSVEKEEQQTKLDAFHDFLEDLSPSDFTDSPTD